MGWWPFSGSQSDSAQSESASNVASAEHASPIQQQVANKEDNPDRELQSFLASFESPRQTSRAQHETITAPSEPYPTPTLSLRSNESAQPQSDELDISPQAMYPRTMSCRQAFDQAFYCQSLGGKFNDLYRYGALQSCSEQWEAFWFCMRVKSQGDDEKQRAIAEYYRAREEKKKKEKGSSEDVWEIRMTPVKKAFWRDPDEPVLKAGDDALTRASGGSDV